MTSTTITRPAEVTADQRRAALVELADHIDTEDRYPNSAPFTPVLPILVSALCSRKVASDVDLALNLFSQLVEAVAEFTRFCGNESSWLDTHDLPTSDRQRQATFADLQSDVDTWADRLMGVTG